MKITLLVTLLFGLVFMTAVSAAEKELTPQQQKMSVCNKEASSKSLKGDERKKDGAAQDGMGLTPQQQKMRECNAQATQQSLKGDDRSKFMSACLKKQV